MKAVQRLKSQWTLAATTVKSLTEAITLVLQQRGKQDSANACTRGSTPSMCRNIKLPWPYSKKQKFQDMEYAKLVNIPDEQKRAYVVNLLDEKAYKAMELTLWRHCRLTNLSAS